MPYFAYSPLCVDSGVPNHEFVDSILSLPPFGDDSLSLLRQAFAEGYEYGISLHRDIDLEPLREYPPFIELMRPKG